MLESQFIKKLQEKPEPVKHIIMWTTALFIMILIFSFWLWNFSKSLEQSGETQDSPATQSGIELLPSAWSSFKSQLRSSLDLLKNINF